MQTRDIRSEIHNYVVANFLFDSDDVTYDAALVEGGVVDSTGVLELVLFVEEHFGIAVNDTDVIPENFDSINALTAFVASRWSVPGEAAS
jgi:acyl carrier protein